MPSETLILFPPFRLDVLNAQLWRDNELVPVRPKPFAVLTYLAMHAGRLVTATELRKAIWPNMFVGEGLLRGYIREVRMVLGDDPETPRFIETVPRRGYRFVAAVTTISTQGGAWSVEREASPPAPVALRSPLSALRLVGRDAELAQLRGWLAKALNGTRQVVFVTGEPGIGKTTLLDAFLGGIRNWELGSGSAKPQTPNPGLWIARGQCIEHYGASEAYLPVLEALGQLCRQPGGEQVVALLSRYAPTWLVQMPALLSDAELEALQRKVQGATRERMLREMAGALEALTAEQPLVLVIEDLHWSDYSTLDLLASLARRRGPARLLLLSTYRPADVIVQEHPLRAMKQELQIHRQCEELPLGFLTGTEVNQYLAARFSQREFPRELAQIIHQSTEGNPLFMVNVVDYWVSQGVLVETDGQWRLAAPIAELAAGVSESLRQMIEKQLERLTQEERRMVETASVVGGEFSTAAVAAGLEEQAERVEEWCEALAAQDQFVRARGMETLANGMVTGRYSFLHALYQQVLYERLALVRRIHLHRRIGDWEEGAYGGRVGEHAAELAVHFERGRAYERAVHYMWQAAKIAVRRYALQEAVALLNKGLDLLKTLPNTPERARQELNLLMTLGLALMAAKGQAAPEVAQTYTRARELCQQVGEMPQLFLVLWELGGFHLVRAELQTARELGEHLLTLTQRQQDPRHLAKAYMSLGLPLFWQGEFAPAREHLERGIALYDSQQHDTHVFRAVQDRSVVFSYTAATLWQLGYADQALKKSLEAIALARELSHPVHLAVVLSFAAWLSQFRREWQAVQKQAEEAIAIATDQGFSYWLAAGTILRGWARAEQGWGEEGIMQMHQGLVAYQATGAELARTHFLALLAEAYGKVGQAKAGLSVLAEALAVVEKTGERIYEAELYRLYGELSLRVSEGASERRGELLLAQEGKNQKLKGKKRRDENPNPRSPILNPESQGEAEASFHKALEIARQQQAKSLELRAAVSLARLWRQQGKKKQAQRMLARIYGWFTEGFDTADLQDARVLLTSDED